MNAAIILGRLIRDPVIKATQSGMTIARFTLAVNRLNKKGQNPEADFINCVAFGKTADAIGNNTHKGTYVGVVGRIQVRSYDDKDGKKRWVTEIVAKQVFLGLFKEGPSTGGADKPPNSFDGMGETINDEEVPF